MDLFSKIGQVCFQLQHFKKAVIDHGNFCDIWSHLSFRIYSEKISCSYFEMLILKTTPNGEGFLFLLTFLLFLIAVVERTESWFCPNKSEHSFQKMPRLTHPSLVGQGHSRLVRFFHPQNRYWSANCFRLFRKSLWHLLTSYTEGFTTKLLFQGNSCKPGVTGFK